MALRSEYLTKGVETAPQRSLLYACGYTKEELCDWIDTIADAKNQ